MRRLHGRLRPGGRARRALLVVGASWVLGASVAVVVRRVAVEGTSMLPVLEPGDRLVAVWLPPFWPLRPGAVVALRDPRDPHRVLVKRVSRTRPGRLEVLGDNPRASTDSRHFGPVPRSAVLGRCIYRYAPSGRAGLL